MNIRDVVGAAVAIALCEAAGLAGSLFTAPAVGSAWYVELAKPALQPPAWVFAPVWVTLYALMGLAAWLVWRDRGAVPSAALAQEGRWALELFALQLALNALWSVLFFGYRSPELGLLGILALLATLVATTRAFSRVSRAAAWLMAPYLAWVAFATYLNLTIWLLN